MRILKATMTSILCALLALALVLPAAAADRSAPVHA